MLKFCLTALIVLFLFSCAPVGPDLLPVERPAKEELILQLNLGSSEFRSVKGLAKGIYRHNGKRKSATQVVLAQYPDKLRLETLGLFGGPVLMAATDGYRATVLLPGEGRAFVGPADTGFLQEFLNLSLSAEEIIATILLRPVFIVWETTSIQYLADGISRLSLLAGEFHQEVDFDQQRRIVRIARFHHDKLLSSVVYDEFSAGFPHFLEIQIPPRDLSVSLNFSDVALNVDHKEGVFSLTPPSAYIVEPFPGH